jgi:hypothetical protein
MEALVAGFQVQVAKSVLPQELLDLIRRLLRRPAPACQALPA